MAIYNCMKKNWKSHDRNYANGGRSVVGNLNHRPRVNHEITSLRDRGELSSPRSGKNIFVRGENKCVSATIGGTDC